ncbi:RNA-guided endonuclease InsQ/TnpB family protein [Fischerella thermalis]|uniref:RNA-guided endonuclease InsQ/TnpB family protein n=1 Tax=Fischerella thermalis TaxID=372787 RepID=UPI002155E6E6|nr:transposase [Fischerella thermalis]
MFQRLGVRRYQPIRRMSNYTVRKLKIGNTEQMQSLSCAAGELYSQTVINFWRTVRKKGKWLKPSSLMRWLPNDSQNRLHAHSADAVVQNFFASLNSWRERRKSDPDARPPRRLKRFFKVQWKSSAIKVKDGKLRLSNGRGNEPLIIDWAWDAPKLVEMGWDGKEYELRACYASEEVSVKKSGSVAGVDLGEIHLAVAHDGKETIILNGRLLRSKRRYQNKLKVKLSRLIDVKKRGSKRRKRLILSKQKQLAKLNNQIRDIQHKQTTKLVSTLNDRGVQTLVIGDIRDIRKSVDYGKKANQKIHQMVYGQTRQMLTYKSKRLGMKVELQDERYTSQTCPTCGKRHKPKNRIYKCSCGFNFHRDGVGSINIRKKYLGVMELPVVGAMASPIGVRYSAHLRCSAVHFRSSESDRERIPCL